MQYQQINKKHTIGLTIIAVYAILILIIPILIGKHISPILAVSSLVMVSVYVLLALEVIHRTVLSLVGTILIISSAVAFGSIAAKDTLDFIIDSIDFNTIGLLLGMMIIVAILGETGVFYWVGIKAGKISKGNLWKLMLPQ